MASKPSIAAASSVGFGPEPWVEIDGCPWASNRERSIPERSIDARELSVHRPKPISNNAAIHCIALGSILRSHLPPQATAESDGSVPSQKAPIIAMLAKTLPAAPEAIAKRYSQPQGSQVLKNPQTYALRVGRLVLMRTRIRAIIACHKAIDFECTTP